MNTTSHIRIAMAALAVAAAVTVGGAERARAQTTDSSSISVSEDNAGPVIGNPIRFWGILTFSGAVSPMGATVHIVRNNPDQTQTPLPDTTVISDQGGYNFQDTPPTRGAYTYTVSYDGNDQRSGATGTSDLITVWGNFATLTLAVDHRVVPYAGAVTLTAHLSHPGIVSIWRTPYGQPRSLVTSAMTDTDGMLVATVHPGRNTTFSASYGGDDQYEPAHSAVHGVDVHAKVNGAMLGGYGSSGGYRLFHYNPSCAARRVGCPVYQATVLPNHHGSCVRLTLQERVGSTWRLAGTVNCVRLDGNSRVRVALAYHLADRGHAFRWMTHTDFSSQSINLQGASAWTYFKITA